MRFVIAFLAVLLLILIILVLKISVRIALTDDFTLKLYVGIFRLTIYPRKEKNIRLSDYKIKKYRKRLKKQEEKERKKLLGEKRKKEGKKAKTTVTNKKDAQKKQDIMELIDKIREVASEFLTRFGRHLHIKVRRLYIVVGTDNAADTAMLYGAVCGGVACLIELMQNCLHLKYTNDAVVSVQPDFTGTKTKASVDITFSFRIWQLFDTIIRSAWKYYNYD